MSTIAAQDPLEKAEAQQHVATAAPAYTVPAQHAQHVKPAPAAAPAPVQAPANMAPAPVYNQPGIPSNATVIVLNPEVTCPRCKTRAQVCLLLFTGGKSF